MTDNPNMITGRRLSINYIADREHPVQITLPELIYGEEATILLTIEQAKAMRRQLKRAIKEAELMETFTQELEGLDG